MIFRHLDPVRDAEAYYEAQEQAHIARRERLPRCSECGKPIETDTFYEVFDEYICPDCMDKHIVYTDDYLEDL